MTTNGYDELGDVEDLGGVGGKPPEPAQPPKPSGVDALAPRFSVAYGRPQLEDDGGRGLVALGHLPPWPCAQREIVPAYGHGWGDHLGGDVLGGGLRPGEMMALGAASAGAGKTAFLMQLADGLALRNEQVLREEKRWGAALTPVLLASEMGIDALSWRSLARWTGSPAYHFRAGRNPRTNDDTRRLESSEAWAAAEAALEGEFGRARDFMRLLDARQAGEAAATDAKTLLALVRSVVGPWRDELAHEHPGREIVPIVIVDPLQRYQSGQDDVRDLNALARELCAAAVENKWIVLVTSDTNKNAAAGLARKGEEDASEEGASIFRGSYNLIHEVTAALYLRKVRTAKQDDDDKRAGIRMVETVVVKNRWGASAPPWPRFRWHGPALRFFPQSREATENEVKRERDEAKEAKAAKSANDTVASASPLDDGKDILGS